MDMERDYISRLADYAVATRNAQHGDKDFFSNYMIDLRRITW